MQSHQNCMCMILSFFKNVVAEIPYVGGFSLVWPGDVDKFILHNVGMMSLLHNYVLAMAHLEEYSTIFPPIPHLLQVGILALIK